MNSYSAFARGVVCTAVIGCAISAAACNTQQPTPTEKSLSAGSTAAGVNSQTDKWEALASDQPADMAEVQGKTFGLDGWKQPVEVGKAQGFIGIAQLGTKCMVIVGPGIIAGPSTYTVMVESRLGDVIVNPEIAFTIDDIQSAIDRNRESCK